MTRNQLKQLIREVIEEVATEPTLKVGDYVNTPEGLPARVVELHAGGKTAKVAFMGNLDDRGVKHHTIYPTKKLTQISKIEAIKNAPLQPWETDDQKRKILGMYATGKLK